MSLSFQQFLESKGILWQTAPRRTPTIMGLLNRISSLKMQNMVGSTCTVGTNNDILAFDLHGCSYNPQQNKPDPQTPIIVCLMRLILGESLTYLPFRSLVVLHISGSTLRFLHFQLLLQTWVRIVILALSP